MTAFHVERPVMIAVLGAHSTGRSTFLARLAHDLRRQHIEVATVADLGEQAQRIGLPILFNHTWASTLWIITRGVSNDRRPTREHGPTKAIRNSKPTGMESDMTAGRYFELYGLPCGQCGQPAHHIEVYPNGVRTVHSDRWKRPCDSVRPASNQPDRSGSEPPPVLPRAPRAGPVPNFGRCAGTPTWRIHRSPQRTREQRETSVEGRLFALVSAEDYGGIFPLGMEITHRDECEAVIYRPDPTTRRTMHAVHESAEAARTRYSRLLPVDLAWMDFRDEVANLLAQLDAEPALVS